MRTEPKPPAEGLVFVRAKTQSASLKASNLSDKETRWRCADASEPYQYLTLWNVKDLAIAARRLKDEPTDQELFRNGAGARSGISSTELDAKYYEFVEIVEKESHTNADTSSHIITAGMQPEDQAASDDLDQWYLQEHNQQMSYEPAWIRTKRYKLASDYQPGDPGGEARDQAPEWMTIHEFGKGNNLGTYVQPLSPVTDWTKNIMSKMSAIEAKVWENMAGPHTSKSES